MSGATVRNWQRFGERSETKALRLVRHGLGSVREAEKLAAEVAPHASRLLTSSAKLVAQAEAMLCRLVGDEKRIGLYRRKMDPTAPLPKPKRVAARAKKAGAP